MHKRMSLLIAVFAFLVLAFVMTLALHQTALETVPSNTSEASDAVRNDPKAEISGQPVQEAAGPSDTAITSPADEDASEAAGLTSEGEEATESKETENGSVVITIPDNLGIGGED